jgi:Copper transport outer membrane protein, MctB
MFDLRYHVASLAAVFFALVIGILVGVALASHGLGDTERSRLERQIDVANARLKTANDRLGQAQEDNRADSAFVDSAYDALMTDRLRGRRIAVLFIGSVEGTLLRSINRTLSDGSATRLRQLAITVPVNDGAIDGALADRPQLAVYAGADKLDDLGRELASEFVRGGDTPVWSALQNQLVEERSGNMRRPADGVVVARSAAPQLHATARFLHGLYSGLADAGVPVVGVETSQTKPSAVRVFQKYPLFSSVDDLDKPVGRVALALLLAGASTGSYGIKETADDVLPQVSPVAPRSPGG